MLPVGGKLVKLQLWDSDSIRRPYLSLYSKLDYVIIVFDATNEQSFANIERHWLEEADLCTPKKHFMKVVVGNKWESPDTSVTQEQLDDLTLRKQVEIFKVSASEVGGYDVRGVMLWIANVLVDRHNTLKKHELDSRTITLNSCARPSESKCW